MATFSAMQSRVSDGLIDVPSTTSSYISTWINAGYLWLQSTHNFTVMRATQTFVTTSTPALGVNQTHVIGQIPSDFKQQRGDPYYQLFQGYTRTILWLPNRENTSRAWALSDINSVGAPLNLMIGEAENDVTPDPHNPDNDLDDLNIEVYPYPDGSSDWADGNYRIAIPYWRYLPALAAGGDNSWLTRDGPQTEFLVEHALMQGFFFNEDETRAGIHKQLAYGGYDGHNLGTLGGFALAVMNLDRGMLAAPLKRIATRRDVFAKRDQWR